VKFAPRIQSATKIEIKSELPPPIGEIQSIEEKNKLSKIFF
jgi:hypothetical protein